MTHYKKTLKIEDYVFDDLQEILQKPNTGSKKNGIELDEEVEFGNGLLGVLQVCGPAKPLTETCFAQFLLYDDFGNEICCSDPLYDLNDTLKIKYDNDLYLIQLQIEKTEPVT